MSKVKVRIFLFFLLYFSITVMLSRLHLLPPFLSKFFAASSVFVLPFLIGTIINNFITKIDDSFPSSFFVNWGIGLITLLLSSFIIYFVFTFNIIFILVTVTSFVLIVLAYASRRHISPLKSLRIDKLRIDKNSSSFFFNRKASLSLFSLLIGLLPAIFTLSLRPYPEIYHTSLPWHLRAVLTFSIVDPSSSLLLKDFRYGTFSYTWSLYMILATASYLYDVDPYYLFITIPLVFYPLYTLGLFSFSSFVANDLTVGAFSSVIGPWLMTYEGLFQENYSITPRGLLYMIFPFLLLSIWEEIPTKVKFNEGIKTSIAILATYSSYYLVFSVFYFNGYKTPNTILWQLFIPLVFVTAYMIASRIFNLRSNFTKKFFLIAILMLVIHTYESFLYVFVLTLLVMLLFLCKRKKFFSISLAFGSITLLALLVLEYFKIITLPGTSFERLLFGYTYSLNLPPAEIMASHFYSFIEGNTLFFVILFMVGCTFFSWLLLIAFLQRKMDKPIYGLSSLTKKYSHVIVMVFLSLFILELYVFPQVFMDRIGSTIAPLFIAVLSLFITLPFNKLGRQLKVNMGKKWSIKLFSLVIISLCFTPLLLQPITLHHHVSYISWYEHAPCESIRKMPPILQRSILVISDPRTIVVFSGMTHCTSPIPRLFLESEYNSTHIEIINRIKKYIFFAESPYNAYREAKVLLKEFDCSQGLIIIEGRTLKWLNSAGQFMFLESPDLSTFSALYIPIPCNSPFGRLYENIPNNTLTSMSIYVKNVNSEENQITFYFSSSLNETNRTYELNISIPPNFEGWITKNISLNWNHTSLFIWQNNTSEGVYFFHDRAPPHDYYLSDSSWTVTQKHYWMIVHFGEESKVPGYQPRYLWPFLDDTLFKLVFSIKDQIYIFVTV
ncbi:MAG: hypothetical protein QW297_00325 [Candidatus Jordarchaeales archaeon]